MELIKPRDLINANPSISLFGSEFFARFLMYALQFNRLNKVYAKVGQKQDVEFIDAVIKTLEISINYDENELKRIPVSGAVVVVANHPLGGLDAIIFIKMMASIRNDVKILGGPLLKKIAPISDYFIDTAVTNSASHEAHLTFAGMNEAEEHLSNNGLLFVFPAVETGFYDVHSNVVKDKIWRYPVVRFIKSMKMPVVPLFFQVNTSRIFKIISRIHPAFKNTRLPSELFRKKNKNIKVRIGNPIRPADQEKFTDGYQYGRYLRAKIYGMENPIEVKRFFNYSLRGSVKPETIIEPVSKDLIIKEIQSIKQDFLLFKLKEYSVYAVPSSLIPNILTEIGRLREITFREVGEGTNQSIDLDEFDLYYHQMFIWDEQTEQIVGAYRIGLGHEIMEQYGVRGFYLHSLFRISDNMSETLMQSLELGRSFVIKEYQRRPMPLFLLWKGILYFTLKNPQYRYLIGPVSISNNYSKTSKELIIKFIMANHFDWQMAQKIKPRNSYVFKSDSPDLNILMENMERDINKLDKIIGDVDELNSGLPVLLKKYIKLNAKITGFNVDPKFNNCLDGLIVLDIFDVPKSTIESLSKEVNDGSLLERFYSNRE